MKAEIDKDPIAVVFKGTQKRKVFPNTGEQTD